MTIINTSELVKLTKETFLRFFGAIVFAFLSGVFFFLASKFENTFNFFLITSFSFITFLVTQCIKEVFKFKKADYLAFFLIVVFSISIFSVPLKFKIILSFFGIGIGIFVFICQPIISDISITLWFKKLLSAVLCFIFSSIIIAGLLVIIYKLFSSRFFVSTHVLELVAIVLLSFLGTISFLSQLPKIPTKEFTLKEIFKLIFVVIVSFIILLFFIPTVETENKKNQNQYYSYVTDYPPMYDIHGYHVLTRLEIFHVFDSKKKGHFFIFKNKPFFISWNSENNTIEIISAKKTLIKVSVENFVKKLLISPNKTSRILPQKFLTITDENENLKIKIFFDDISLQESHKTHFYHFKSDILINFKKFEF